MSAPRTQHILIKCQIQPFKGDKKLLRKEKNFFKNAKLFSSYLSLDSLSMLTMCNRCQKEKNLPFAGTTSLLQPKKRGNNMENCYYCHQVISKEEDIFWKADQVVNWLVEDGNQPDSCQPIFSRPKKFSIGELSLQFPLPEMLRNTLCSLS